VTSRRNQTESLAIKHVDPELWRWLKARADLEDKTRAQLLSELIERYWKEVGWSEENLCQCVIGGGKGVLKKSAVVPSGSTSRRSEALTQPSLPWKILGE